MKQRFSSIDVKVICKELSEALTGLRVSNIYDLSSRIFLFKLAKPDHRRQFIIDSGFRCHLTEYSRTTASAPSGFVSRLRKCLKTRRVTAINQLGTDRIIDITFSDGAFHIFLEFFAGGNIILTDADRKIVALFRQVPATGDQEEVKVGLQYSVEKAQYYNGVPALSKERLREALERAVESYKKAENAPKKSKKKVDVFRRALTQGFPEFPPLLLEDAFAATGFDSSVALDKVLGDQQLFQDAMNVLQEAERVIKQVGGKGFIVAVENSKAKSSGQSENSAAANLLYEDFHPFRPRQFEGKPGHTILEYDSFNKTVDEYFSSIESQRLESRLTEHEEAAKRKLEAARADHHKRAGALKQAQELHIRKAEAIQANVYRVQEAIDAVNGLIAQGMDWVEIASLIQMEQGRNNPVAQIIKLPLKLHENVVTLMLSEASVDAEEEEDDSSDFDSEESEDSDSGGGQPTPVAEQLAIDIDLALSPWSNATQYYDQKKSAAIKEQKTIQSSEKALKSQEKKVTQDLKRNLKQEKQVLRPSRKAFWFEKYIYFISTDGYLVVGGRDVHQVEILYRRYLNKGDIFVHADLEGATPMIIKNKAGTPDAPIPPGTLAQAGTLSVATSKVWESKALMPSWWAHAHQVSKTNERGELLATGGFVIKGEKNFLAPAQPILGFAVLFQISKESIANHRKHRVEESSNVESKEDTVSNVQEPDPEDPAPTSENAAIVEAEEDDDEGIDGVVDEKSTQVHEDSNSDSDSEDDQGSKTNPLQTSTNEAAAGRDIEIETEEANQQEDEDSEDGGVDAVETTDSKNLTTNDAKSSSTSDRNTLRSNTPTPSQVSSNKQTIIRGKKGKAKKAAQKYAHQDEEDRELALRLLGSNAKANKAVEAAETKAKQEADLEAQRRRRRAQHERAAEAERKRQEQFQQNGSGDAEIYDEETAKVEAEDLSWLPALVGVPLPEDEVIAALPVAAPWPALARFKYRAKLQPGNVKKGKAIKEILGHWIVEASGAVDGNKVGKKIIADDVAEGLDRATAERMRAREADLLKGWRDVEVMNTLPVGKVRIVSGGSTTGGGGGGGKGGNKGGGGVGKGGDKGGKGKGGGGTQKGGKGSKKK
ncbi:fibronectin-binding protein A N-terminus-domain-containing protein [Talaromyces proteolyticus]|uniref:Ribosome quality control complex subunit 2 n=1 Tax=Talaromyces proteolyticus TaxID=1131652 RepID=A0AAD4L6I3_9EURO|nr:fibronectin-binding protein A N-terminus-domain-containing protein [Talaromyces proteolyticus]KAH8704839.1 fibronectin-binding protein A N-terminus-domain-containing protein [Talaromyces proteolyticus]